VSLDPNISDFETVFADCNPLAVDLLRKLLTFNPEERLTVQQSLAHPYLQAYHCEEDEPSCEPASRYDFEFESQLLTGADLKAMIHEEIMLHHFPSKQ
jgi:mitogen-activated protein kinase 1/3